MPKKNFLWVREDFRMEDNLALHSISSLNKKFMHFLFMMKKNLKIGLLNSGGYTKL